MSKYARFNIEFENEEKCNQAFEMLNDFQENAQKRYKEFKPDYDGTVSTCFHSLEEQGNTSLSFELSSTRDRNLDWQVQMALTLLKENGGVDEVNCDIWVDTNEGYYFADGELAEFEGNLN